VEAVLDAAIEGAGVKVARKDDRNELPDGVGRLFCRLRASGKAESVLECDNGGLRPIPGPAMTSRVDGTCVDVCEEGGGVGTECWESDLNMKAGRSSVVDVISPMAFSSSALPSVGAFSLKGTNLWW